MVRDVIATLGAGDLSQRLPHVYITVPPAVAAVPLPIRPGPPVIHARARGPGQRGEYAAWRGDVPGSRRSWPSATSI